MLSLKNTKLHCDMGQIKIKHFKIIAVNEPQSGILPEIWELKGDFYFQDEDELHMFAKSLEEPFSMLTDYPVVVEWEVVPEIKIEDAAAIDADLSVEIYFDGACEPVNPGGAMAMGFIVFYDGREVYQACNFVPADPANSNNVSEYLGLKMVLDYIDAHPGLEYTVFGDSKLVINQMQRHWKIKRGLYVDTARECLKRVYEIENKEVLTVAWVPGSRNLADQLTTKKLQEHGVARTEWSKLK